MALTLIGRVVVLKDGPKGRARIEDDRQRRQYENDMVGQTAVVEELYSRQLDGLCGVRIQTGPLAGTALEWELSEMDEKEGPIGVGRFKVGDVVRFRKGAPELGEGPEGVEDLKMTLRLNEKDPKSPSSLEFWDLWYATVPKNSTTDPKVVKFLEEKHQYLVGALEENDPLFKKGCYSIMVESKDLELWS